MSIIVNDRPASLMDTSVIENKNARIVLDVAIPYYADQFNFRTDYKIEGISDDWRGLGNNHQISFTHLNPGFNVLQIRVKTGFGLDQDTYSIKSVFFYLKPAFYQTTAFKIFLALLLLFIIFYAIVASIKIQKKKKIINQQNGEILSSNKLLVSKSNELSGLVEKLEAAVTEIKQSKELLEDNIYLREKLISLILHDLKSPLYFQSILLNQITSSSSINPADAKQIFSELKKSNSSILKFIKDFLTWYSTQKDGFTVSKQEILYDQVIEDILEVYEDVIRIKKIKLEIVKNSAAIFFTDRNIFEVIVRNIIDNAIKYTDKGSINISFQSGIDEVGVVFRDTGRGIAPDLVKQFNANTLVDPGPIPVTFGYEFIISMAHKIGASIHLDSDIGIGTTVSVMLPLTTDGARMQ
jgi:signal transduction histidine kinase